MISFLFAAIMATFGEEICLAFLHIIGYQCIKIPVVRFGPLPRTLCCSRLKQWDRRRWAVGT